MRTECAAFEVKGLPLLAVGAESIQENREWIAAELQRTRDDSQPSQILGAWTYALDTMIQQAQISNREACSMCASYARGRRGPVESTESLSAGAGSMEPGIVLGYGFNTKTITRAARTRTTAGASSQAKGRVFCCLRHERRVNQSMASARAGNGKT